MKTLATTLFIAACLTLCGLLLLSYQSVAADREIALAAAKTPTTRKVTVSSQDTLRSTVRSPVRAAGYRKFEKRSAAPSSTKTLLKK